MPPKRSAPPASEGKKESKEGQEAEAEVVEVIDEPRPRKQLFVADPNKQYRMTAAQWAVAPRSVLIYILCPDCMQYYKDCGGSPNLGLLICDLCTLENYKLRFPDAKPLQPLPAFPRPQDWNRPIEQAKNAQ